MIRRTDVPEAIAARRTVIEPVTFEWIARSIVAQSPSKCRTDVSPARWKIVVGAALEIRRANPSISSNSQTTVETDPAQAFSRRRSEPPRTTAVTTWPWRCSAATRSAPRNPDAPVTSVRCASNAIQPSDPMTSTAGIGTMNFPPAARNACCWSRISSRKFHASISR